jgi:hypothetical protein
MATESVQSDKGLGIAVVFSILAVLGALVMLAGPDQMSKAWGFAAACLAGAIAVVAVQIWN